MREVSGKTVWDRVSPVYDTFESALNGQVYNRTGELVAEYIDPRDEVLECACGTGAISIFIARKCRRLTATDMSSNMLNRAAKKLMYCFNVRLAKADITNLKCRDERFDKVVAGNVVHLLDEPEKAVQGLMRVCKTGGKVIIPTYINLSNNMSRTSMKALSAAGLRFKKEFDLDSYKQFFADMGYPDAEFVVAEGRFPCAIAVITKK